MVEKYKRRIKEKPRTFESFPEDSICPGCNTSDDGECVLVGIDGTADGGIQEAKPFHLSCAIATNYDERDQFNFIYRLLRMMEGRE